MGYLTTIVIHNDALHSFKKDPKTFGEAVFKAMEKANFEHKEASAPCQGYANYINAHPSRHADDETVYIHTGTVFQLNEYSEDFKELAKRDVKLTKDLIRRSQRIITRAKKSLAKEV
jgi:hypothetical protein